MDRKNEIMEENKLILKDKFEKGKLLGEVVNKARDKINKYKNQVNINFMVNDNRLKI